MAIGCALFAMDTVTIIKRSVVLLAIEATKIPAKRVNFVSVKLSSG